MDIDWAIRGLVGGALIGISATLLLALNGRVAGISGITSGLLAKAPKEEHLWRALFLGGLALGGIVGMVLIPGAFDGAATSVGVAAVAGLLVGVGTRIGNGCTSGHGVCGLSRFSARSLVATLTFIGTGAIAVAIVRAIGGAP